MAFSPASSSLLACTLRSRWLIIVKTFVLIGPDISRHRFNLSDAIIKTVVFPRASSSLLACTLRSQWLMIMKSFVLIGSDISRHLFNHSDAKIKTVAFRLLAL